VRSTASSYFVWFAYNLSVAVTITYAFYGTVANASRPLLSDSVVRNRAQELYDGSIISNETRAYSFFFMDVRTYLCSNYHS